MSTPLKFIGIRSRPYFHQREKCGVCSETGADFTVLATNQMGEVCMATPAIYDQDFGKGHRVSKRLGKVQFFSRVLSSLCVRSPSPKRAQTAMR